MEENELNYLNIGIDRLKNNGQYQGRLPGKSFLSRTN
jgi:hypothetical protein